MLQEELRQMWTPDAIPNRSARHLLRQRWVPPGEVRLEWVHLCRQYPVLRRHIREGHGMLQEELRQMWTPDAIPNRSARHSVKDGPTNSAANISANISAHTASRQSHSSPISRCCNLLRQRWVPAGEVRLGESRQVATHLHHAWVIADHDALGHLGTIPCFVCLLDLRGRKIFSFLKTSADVQSQLNTARQVAQQAVTHTSKTCTNAAQRAVIFVQDKRTLLHMYRRIGWHRNRHKFRRLCQLFPLIIPPSKLQVCRPRLSC